MIYRVFNQSRLTDFMACPRFYKLRHVDRWQASTFDLDVGKYTHKLLDRHYRVKEDWIAEEDYPLPEASEEVIALSQSLYNAYDAHFRHENIQVIKPEIVVKAPFGKFKIGGKEYEVWLIATVDGLIRYEGAIYILEHKTTKYIGQTAFDRFLLDFQISCYTWLVSQDLGITVAGAVCNLMPKAKADHEPLRVVVSRTDYNIREWEQSARDAIMRVLVYDLQGFFPQYQTACMRFYRKCDFMDYCMTNNVASLGGLTKQEDDYTHGLEADLNSGKVTWAKWTEERANGSVQPPPVQ